MENKKRAEIKYNYSVRKKLKRILAVTLSLLMMTSVIDYSGFTVNAQTATAEDGAASVTEAEGAITYYNTVEAAITYAQEKGGSTVKLLKDVATESVIEINYGTFAIDLNGYTWSGSETSFSMTFTGYPNVVFKDTRGGGQFKSSVYLIVNYSQLSNISFEGGTYSCFSTCKKIGDHLSEGYAYKSAAGTWVSDVSTKTIFDFTVLPAPVKITAQPENVVVHPDSTEQPVLSVTAEIVPADLGKTISYQWYRAGTGSDGVDELISEATTSNYAVPQGLSAGEYLFYCAVKCDGYTLKSDAATLYVTNSTGCYTVTDSKGLTLKYPTIELAIIAAKSKPGSTVKLLADATTTSTVEVYQATMTIDLNGYTWTSTVSENDEALRLLGGNITLKDSGTGGTFTSAAYATVYAYCTSLTIEGGTYKNTGNCTTMNIFGNQYNVVSIKGGTFQKSSNSDIYDLVYLQGANIFISGGTFSGDMVQFMTCPKVSLTGGTYDGIYNYGSSVGALLENAYGYKTVNENTWVNNASGSVVSNITVKQAPVQITAQPQDASVTYGYASPHTLNVEVVKNDIAAGDISYQWYRDGNSILGATGASFDIPTAFEAGTYSYYCAVSCDGYIVNTQNALFTIAKATPTVTFEAITTGGAPYSYGNEISFYATVLGVNNEKPDGTVTFRDGEDIIAVADFNSNWLDYYSGGKYLDAGNHSFTAVYNPSSTGSGKNYESAVSATLEQAIAKADQMPISITPVTGKIYTDTNDSFKLTTTGGSGTGEVTYSVLDNKDVLSISEDTATIVGAGTVTVTAVKASDVNYKSATATYDITVAKAPAPTITFPTASGITYGQKMSDSHLNGGSTEYGTFTWEGDDLVPVVNGGTNYNNVIFTPSADTIKNYETISNIYNKLTLGFTVTQATPTISLEKLVYDNSGNRTANLTVIVNPVGSGNYPTGTLKFMDCTSGTPVEITDATAVTMVGSQTTYTWKGLAEKVYKIKVVYSGDDQYNGVTSETFEVDTVKKNQSPLIIGNIGAKTYGDGVIALTTTGGDGEGWVSFTSSDSTIVSFPKPELMARLNVANKNTSNHESAVATIHRAGTVTITATKYGDNTYNTTNTSITLTVGKKALVVKADDKQNIVAGSAMPQLTYSVTGLVGSDTFTGPTIVTTAADSNTIGEHEIRISGGTLTNAENYEVTYTNAKLTIMKTSIDHAVVSGITDQNYNGSALEQSGLFVQVNGKTLTKDIDYMVDYKNNTEIGTATVAITGKGIYTGTIAKNFQINVSNGATYTISNMVYMVTSSETNGNGAVTLIKSTKSKSKLKGTLKIRDTVKIGGQSFKITSIDAKAFKGYTKLTKVTIGKNVITIGKEAFSGCSKVSSVTIGTGLKMISNNAFYNCKKLKAISINSKQLKTVGKNALKNTYGSAVIKVPSSKVSAYKKLFKSKTGFTEDKMIKKK